MAREAREALQIDTITPTRYDNIQVHPLSHDDEDALEFSMIAIPDAAGELHLPAGRAADVFVIEGEVTLDSGDSVREGQYAFLAARSETQRRISHPAGARYFVGTEASGDDTNEQSEDMIVDPATVAWDVRVQENAEHTLGGRSVGLVKFLRVDAKSRTTVGLGASWPESGLDCAEYHEQVDEVLNLRGDLLVRDLDGSPAVMDGLSYCWRPKNSIHLPKFSFGGSLTFFRNMKVLWSEHGACTYVPVPEWSHVVADYRLDRNRAAST